MILLAAGASRRLGATTPKPFLRAGGMSLLGRCLRVLDKSPSVARIVLVAPANHLERASRIAGRASRKLVAVVTGGERRQDSVRAGIDAMPDGPSVLVIHDSARPLLTEEMVEATISAARVHGAAIAASPAVDTLKRARDGCAIETLNRSEIWCAETPQAFERTLLMDAIESAERFDVEVTDDAQLVEMFGRTVSLVPSSTPNLKVTTMADLELVRAQLSRRGR